MSESAPTATYQRPWMYEQQLQAIFCDERYAVIEGATKTGKTTSCMVWLFEQAMGGGAGDNVWWTAPVYSQARIAFRRLKRGLPDQLYQANESEMTLTLPNGVVMWFKSAEKPDALYGENVIAAVMDEATRHREEAWHAIRSTLTHTRGKARIIGNVKGRKNWAYRLARRAEAGEPDMRYTKITALDAVAAGVLKQEEIDDARRQLPDNVFRELYLAEPSLDGGNPFGFDAIGRCIRPLSRAPATCFGIDLAKSVDWTVVVGLDAENVVCILERWQGPWQDTISRIKRIVGTTRALVDSTGVGDPVLEALQAESKRNYEGKKFTQPSKQQLMEGLAVDIQQERIWYPEGVIVNELEGFEYVYTRTGVHYSAPDGMYDDAVCALALAATHARGKKIRKHGIPISIESPSKWNI